MIVARNPHDALLLVLHTIAFLVQRRQTIAILCQLLEFLTGRSIFSCRESKRVRDLGHGSRRDGHEQDTSEKHHTDDMGSCYGGQSKFKMFVQITPCLFESSHYEFAGLRCRDHAIRVEK